MKKDIAGRKLDLSEKKQRKRGTFGKFVICGLMLGATVMLTWNGIRELQTTAQLKMSIQENEQAIADLDEEKAELEKTYENLTNSEYVRYYAMGRYHVTQDGEQVFLFPEDDDAANTESGE